MARTGRPPKPGSTDKTTVYARQRREDANAITIPPVIDSAGRQRALDDPIYFIEHCCSSTLKHPLPDALKDFALRIVRTAKMGGNMLCVLPRGSGKTTIITDTVLYLVASGTIHYPVVVGANQAAANAIIRNIWQVLDTSEPLCDCFPELCWPVRAINGRYQRCGLQNIDGERTNIKLSANLLHLADIGGRIGATIVSRGAGASVRGLLGPDGSRPDFVLCDDLQKASTARSDTSLAALERYITEDIRGLGGSDATIACFLAATPLAPNDIVDRLSRRPDFVTVRKPLVTRWPDDRESWKEYAALLYGDLADGTTTAHDYYIAHRQTMDKGGEVLDPLAYPPSMASAIERAYYLQATMGEEAFRQEYLLTPPTQKESIALDPTEVSKRLSLVPHRTVPSDCSVLLASIDCGTATAIHVTVTAYGRHLKAAIVDAYRFPDEGRLGPKDIPQAKADAILSKALVGVISSLVAPGRYRMEGSGKTVPITAIAIDRGYRTTVVDAVAAYFVRRRVLVYPLKGVTNTQYRPSKYTIAKATDCDLRDTDGVRWLAFNADIFKVQVLTAFRGEPLTTGSLCLWGTDSAKVFPVAKQLAGEKLMERYDTRVGEVYRWASSAVGAANHYLDCAAENLALATFLRYREPDSVAAIAASASTPSASSAQSSPALLRQTKRRRKTRIRLGK